MKQTNENHNQRNNKPSTLLSQDENDLVFSLMGRRCQTMNTAVAQLFTTEAPAHSAWIKRASGVACFVRDSSKKSYFIRVFCLASHDLMWEEEMYDAILINKPREFLITFEGQDSMVALNFASDAEAHVFYRTAVTTVSNRAKRRRSRKISPIRNDNGYNANTTTPKMPNGPGPQPLSAAPTNAFAFEARRDKKKFNRKLTKADISTPTDFKHLAHVGWNNNQKCAELNSDVMTFLEKAGVSQQQMNDADTREYIYGFLAQNKLLDSEKQKQAPPPPVPSRNNTLNNSNQSANVRTAPPPPPPTSTIPKLSAQLPTKRNAPPVRPPPLAESIVQPQVQAANIPVPPPPPPPPLSSLPTIATPKVASPTSNIQTSPQSDQGATTPKVEQLAPVNDTRSNLLKEIEKGFKLKPAGDRKGEQPVASATRGTDALADALRKALEARERALQDSSDSEDNADEDEWED